MRQLYLCFSLLILSQYAPAQVADYLSPEQFVNYAFDGKAPKPTTLYLSKTQRDWLTAQLKTPFSALRVKYWQQQGKQVWIENQIGKEYPITTGIVINNGTIEAIKVLKYREIRGGEVRYPFFVKQFKGLGLQNKTKYSTLNGKIDGITGATLSVRAMKIMARRSLLLAQLVNQRNNQYVRTTQ